MDANDDFSSKQTHLNCFKIHTNFEQAKLKPAILVHMEMTGLKPDIIYFFLLQAMVAITDFITTSITRFTTNIPPKTPANLVVKVHPVLMSCIFIVIMRPAVVEYIKYVSQKNFIVVTLIILSMPSTGCTIV